MNKWLLPILFICCAVVGCSKSNNVDLGNVKAQAAIDDKIIANYIANNGLTGKALKATDTSGVYYIIEQQGTGNDLFTNSTQITVGDTGRLLTTGNVFYLTNNFHPSYSLGEVILGWRLGIPKIKTGGLIRLLIPSRYAYGPFAQPSYNLPSNAILDFSIRLYAVTN